jgi:hypothetical protein
VHRTRLGLAGDLDYPANQIGVIVVLSRLTISETHLSRPVEPI